MILIDANILMYAAGAEHPHKAPSLRLLEAIARDQVEYDRGYDRLSGLRRTEPGVYLAG